MYVTLKVLKAPKMKFHQMKVADVARTAGPEVAEIERAEIEFSEIAEIQCFADAVFSFVVAVASVAYLIDFRVDALVASVAAASAVDAPIALMQARANFLLMTRRTEFLMKLQMISFF